MRGKDMGKAVKSLLIKVVITLVYTIMIRTYVVATNVGFVKKRTLVNVKAFVIAPDSRKAMVSSACKSSTGSRIALS
jgi:hypothetical protein